jgi:hypothetical protein|tara:strand:+ start:39 stop:899 length:861 start_codon:yes stop_codon:yes gene_type:complete
MDTLKWIFEPQRNWLNNLSEKRILHKPNPNITTPSNENTGSWYSEDGEDGVIQYLFNHIEDINKFAIDLGAGGGYIGSNIRRIADANEWVTTEIDSCKYDIQNSTVNIERITRDNVVNLLQKYNTPKNVDLFSIDIDSMDYHILKAVFEAGYRSTVMIVEYNPIFSSSESFYRNYDEKYNKDVTSNYGASLACFDKLLSKYGYTLIHAFGEICPINNKKIDSNNAIFIKSEYLKDPVETIHNIQKEPFIEHRKRKRQLKIYKKKLANKTLIQYIKEVLISNTFTEY